VRLKPALRPLLSPPGLVLSAQARQGEARMGVPKGLPLR